MNKLASLVLLAGFSKRMGMPKQHVTIFNKTFLEHIIYSLQKNRSNISSMIFVGQANDIKSIEIANNIGGKWINNPTPELGPLSSIRLALKNLENNYSILLWPTDHPLVNHKTVSKIIEEWKKRPDLITIPSNGQRRGHPSIFPAWACKEMFNINLEKGAKQICINNPDKINHVLTDDPFIIKNLNTPEAIRELLDAVKTSNTASNN